MKRTLFAMAALALMGGQAFAETIYTSGFDGIDFTADEGSLKVFVNGTVTFGNFDASNAAPVTLNFVGENTFSSAEELYMPYLVSVMGDDAAKASWGETLLSSTGAGDYKTITLATSNCSDVWFPETGENDPTFAGASAGDSVTLGNAEVTYLGYFESTSQVKAVIQQGHYENAVALIRGGKDLYLYGLATTPATPEPATATLSLLALAGLASRRRRK